MDGEFNNLSYNNTGTSFSANVNNIQTSDELSADPIYTRKMGTSYSISKGVAKAVVAAGITVTAVGGGMGIYSLFSNSFVTLPTVSDNPIAVSTTDDSLSYDFEVDNDSGEKFDFYVYVKDNLVFSLDIHESGKYQGTIPNLGYDVSGHYEFLYSNGVDYTHAVLEGDFHTIGNPSLS